MRPSLIELLPEALELLLFGVGSVLLSIAGAYIEWFAFLTVESGQLKLGAWVALMGLMAVYFSYLTVTDKFRPKLATFLQTLNGY